MSTSLYQAKTKETQTVEKDQMKSIILILISALILSSCASFSSRIVKKNKTKITEKNLNKLEGSFELFPDTSYTHSGNPEIIKSKAVLRSFYYFVSKNKTEFDSLATYSVELKFINNKKIKFLFKKEDVKIDSTEIGGKLKNNGLFHLDNKYVKRNGIPFIFGGFTSNKTRIGLAKDNGLLVNYAFDVSGALLIIIGDGFSYNSAFHYKRIENK
ncbi:hypothetical protein [Flavobacterium ustbae]|uniref:hypothetical protein n=1 Tax=Flavobacterium ustbae TaxID=2488790 RepID=UPI000F7ADB3F|nr:hypothetical protein [Flavobacterium ustbae]